jgi:beta-lactam-binding protein with PASTA domain
VGSVTTLHFPGAEPGTVIAQSPPPNARNAASPKINLIVVAADNAPQYVMPNFVGKSLAEATGLLERAGFNVGNSHNATRAHGPGGTGVPPGIIVRQKPAAGQKVAKGANVSFEVRR